MSNQNRRDFFRSTATGMAGLGVGGILLSKLALPTESSGAGQPDANSILKVTRAKIAADSAPTEDNILGPFYRKQAPYRAKITPPAEPGTLLVIQGQVWGHDTRKPLANAELDVWQANKDGRYDNDDSNNPPDANLFLYRARVSTDENGYYEFETIHPGRYKIGRDLWRPAHIHFMVRAAGYQSLITQMYFKDDPMNDKDQFIKKSLIVEIEKIKLNETEVEKGRFDIVLAKK